MVLTDNIRGFQTELRENKGSLKTAFGENETALRLLSTFGEAGVCIGLFRSRERLSSL